MIRFRDRKGFRFVILPVFFVICSFCLLPHFLQAAESPQTPQNVITVSFRDTPLSECIDTLLQLSGSAAAIRIVEGKNVRVNKTAVNQRWDVILRSILVENNLKLAKIDTEYVIVQNNTDAQKTTSLVELDGQDKTAASPEFNCDDLITFGYKYGAGSNPYKLVGRCIKLNNFKPIQYISPNTALARWSYRGESGVVYVEDRSDLNLLNKANSVITQSIGVYEYTSTLGANEAIPHLLLQPRPE